MAREWELGLITEAQMRKENTTTEPPFYSYRLFRRWQHELLFARAGTQAEQLLVD